MTSSVIFQAGICPFCKCPNVEYGQEYYDGDEEVMIFPIRCLKCGRRSDEVYYVEYDHTEGI